MKIWLVSLSTGEYSDRTEWPLVATHSQSEAEYVVRTVQAMFLPLRAASYNQYVLSRGYKSGYPGFADDNPKTFHEAYAVREAAEKAAADRIKVIFDMPKDCRLKVDGESQVWAAEIELLAPTSAIATAEPDPPRT